MMLCAAEMDIDVKAPGAKGIADALRKAADEIERCTITQRGLAQYLMHPEYGDVGVVAISMSGLWKQAA